MPVANQLADGAQVKIRDKVFIPGLVLLLCITFSVYVCLPSPTPQYLWFSLEAFMLSPTYPTPR